jgi:SRSO17 transposase
MLVSKVYGDTSMNIPQIRSLKPKLKKLLKRFDACFPRKDTRAHLITYVSGQISDIPEKSVEPIAINAGVAPRTLQEFLSQHHYCLIDGELDLPQSWSADRPRCREAGIPDDMTYRPKWKIALELYDPALKNGIHFDWMSFDEGYGSKPDFLRGLSFRDQKFVGEIPCNFTGWLKPPRVVTGAYHKNGRGRGRKVPRLASGSKSAQRVDEFLKEPIFP